MAYSLLLSSLINQIINASPNKELLHYSYAEQLKDILPYVLLATGMGIVVYMCLFLGLATFPTLCIQVLLGIAIYLIASIVFKLEPFYYLVGIIKNVGGKA